MADSYQRSILSLIGHGDPIVYTGCIDEDAEKFATSYELYAKANKWTAGQSIDSFEFVLRDTARQWLDRTQSAILTATTKDKALFETLMKNFRGEFGRSRNYQVTKHDFFYGPSRRQRAYVPFRGARQENA